MTEMSPSESEVELLNKFFAAEMRARGLAGKVEIEYRQAAWGKRLVDLLKDSDDVDILASGITPTPKRERDWNVRFSRPTIKFYSAAVTLQGTLPLKEGNLTLGKIGAANNTTNKDFLISLYGSSERVYIESESPYYDHLVDRLMHNEIQGFVIDSLYYPQLIALHPELLTKAQILFLRPVVNNKFQLWTAAYALRPQDVDLINELNNYLLTADNDRKLLQSRYFPELPFFPLAPR